MPDNNQQVTTITATDPVTRAARVLYQNTAANHPDIQNEINAMRDRLEHQVDVANRVAQRVADAIRPEIGEPADGNAIERIANRLTDVVNSELGVNQQSNHDLDNYLRRSHSFRYVSNFRNSTDNFDPNTTVLIDDNAVTWRNNATLADISASDQYMLYEDTSAASGSSRIQAQTPIDFHSFFEDGSTITKEALDTYINRTLRVIDEAKEEISKRSIKLDDQVTLIREETNAVNKLRGWKEKIWNEFPQSPENRLWLLNQITAASSDFFTEINVLQENYPVIKPSDEEKEIIGKILANKVVTFMYHDDVREALFKDIQNDVQSTISQNFYTITDKAYSSTFEILQHLETYVWIKPDVDVGRFPSSSKPNDWFTSENLYKGLLAALHDGEGDHPPRVNERYANGLFNYLIHEAMVESDIAQEIQRPIIESFINEISEILTEKSFSVIRWDKIRDKLLDTSLYEVSLYRARYDYYNSQIGIRIKANVKFNISDIFETVKSRGRFIRSMYRNMVEPYERYDRKSCEQVYNAVKNLCVIDNQNTAANSIYPKLKVLDKEYSLFDQYDFEEDGCSIETSTIEDCPFFFRTKSCDMRGMQIIYTLLKASVHNQNCVLRLRSKDEFGMCLRLPLEYMIKLMGHEEFHRFVERRREAEILAFAAVAIFKSKCPDDIKKEDINNYWDINRCLDSDSMNYVATHYLDPKFREWHSNHTVRWTFSLETDSDILKIISNWDRSRRNTGLSGVELFSQRLIQWAKEGYQRAFLTNDTDRKLIGLIRHQHAMMTHKSREFVSRKFWPMIKARFNDKLKEVIEENKGIYNPTLLYEEVMGVLNDKHLFIGRKDPGFTRGN